MAGLPTARVGGFGDRPEEWTRRDSNSWPPPCEGGALPTELRALCQLLESGRCWTLTSDLCRVKPIRSYHWCSPRSGNAYKQAPSAYQISTMVH